MQRTIQLAWLVLIVTAPLDAADGLGGAATGDREKIQGVWLAAGITDRGEKSPLAEEMRMEFKGDQITVTVKDVAPVTGTFTVDPGKAPATMDITIERDGKKVVIPAIFEVTGDDLKLCHPAGESGGRPKVFEATAKTVLATFKRQQS